MIRSKITKHNIKKTNNCLVNKTNFRSDILKENQSIKKIGDDRNQYPKTEDDISVLIFSDM